MKSTEILSGLILTVALLASACTSGSADSTDPSEPTVEQAATTTATVAVEPTEVPIVEPSDDELIAAAASQLEAAGAGNLIAWDVLDSAIDPNGIVSFTLCGWTGETVFDAVYDSLWETSVDDAGSPSARELGTSVDAGECLNTELINSALAFTREYDDFYAEVAAAPETFESDPRLEKLYTTTTAALVAESLAAWANDGLHLRGVVFDGQLPESSLSAPLYRRFDAGLSPVFELAVCRPMPADHGLYRGDLLVDDFRASDEALPHSMQRYSLVWRSSESRWVLDAGTEQVWTDCFFAGSWLDGANLWRPDPMPWVEVPR